ncbi:proteasome lid subunit RPN8/RPN11 [Mitsuaria sp. BK045]|uniref:hypothetical protein n=1 Tax=unclassified Roseateles TaxID=2626991 RepID=UPI00161ACC1D|nr:MULTISPECIES: hypothetical protein [unclassified Roseateles]MBB3295051.1 proteasome lid subunit RPN8/RPN11 [Mitsuaria sp. BK041]MBB3364267.1 proteasome lid subunit RPN8/RPN11 [Mitsuaria sp. BK045]
MKKMVVGLILASLVGVSQARSAVPLVEPDRVVLVAGQSALTPDQVKQAIVRGSAKLGWTVASDEPGKLRLKYNKQNKHEVVVDVSYDNAGFQVRYVNSVNMKYEQVNGVAHIHPFYNTWVSNLSRAISSEVSGTPAAQ